MYIIHRITLEEESGKLPAICRVLFIFFSSSSFLVTKIFCHCYLTSIVLLAILRCQPTSLYFFYYFYNIYIYIFFRLLSFFYVIAALSWLDCPSVCPSVFCWLPFRLAITLTHPPPNPTLRPPPVQLLSNWRRTRRKDVVHFSGPRKNFVALIERETLLAQCEQNIYLFFPSSFFKKKRRAIYKVSAAGETWGRGAPVQ